MKNVALALVTLAVVGLAFAPSAALAQTSPAAPQAKPAPASPPAQASVKIGAASITIDYARPSMKGRKIVGGLVPYDKVWRTGANAATTLKTDAAITIGGTEVPAGTYTIYSLPGEKAWKLIINKQTGQWGTQYDQAQDLARIDLKMESAPQPVELFTITLSASGPNAGQIVLEWESTRLTAPISAK
jgi:uncharacterized iron-regulated membrane protein